ncbi:MAG: serine/threonine-protein kinase [Nocardioides sp.]
MSVSSENPAEGMVIGPYRIIREIGGGGMGVVYEAADDALNRTVALKIISPHLAENDDFRARFTREAQALAALDSPQVIHVYAHGEVDGQLYLATQLVPDGDLGAMLQQFGAPPARVALDVVAQVAAGLSDAHEGGMIHRDIKPANILLRRRGNTMSAYLGDFGIARQLDGEETHASRMGTVGTPSYMAPELHTGGQAGVRSDLYSLGCLLWAALSGHAPYRGTTEYQIVSAHLEQPIPQLPGQSALVTEANRILRTAMAKDPTDRYATAAQLRDDLRRATSLPAVGGGRTGRVAAAGSGGRRGLVVTGLALGVILMVAAIVWGVVNQGDDPVARAVRPSLSAAPTQTPTTGTSGTDLERARTSLADALLSQGLLTEEQAACTAEEWIDSVGLDAMIAEGFFDDDLTFVDQPAAEMSPEMQSAATLATVTCATS